MNKNVPNCARREYDPSIDPILREELDYAGIDHKPEQESLVRQLTKNSEVQTGVMGFWNGWRFTRAWSYWVCEGPGIPFEDAMLLNEKFGKEVRVDGFAGGISPRRFHGLGVGHYHVDTKEGLKALADTIKGVIQRNQFPRYAMMTLGKKSCAVRLTDYNGDWAWYYRDAGDWVVHATVKDGEVVVVEKEDSKLYAANGANLTDCTREVWEESNGMVPQKVVKKLTKEEIESLPVGDQQTPNTQLWYGVHGTHCCAEHGCKYGDEDCPVVKGKIDGVRCELCDENFRIPF